MAKRDVWKPSRMDLAIGKAADVYLGLIEAAAKREGVEECWVDLTPKGVLIRSSEDREPRIKRLIPYGELIDDFLECHDDHADKKHVVALLNALAVQVAKLQALADSWDKQVQPED